MAVHLIFIIAPSILNAVGALACNLEQPDF